MGARAVRGRSGWSDGGSDTWDIEIPAFDKASLYQTMLIFGDLGHEVSFTVSRKFFAGIFERSFHGFG
jgi:hypothetical protein